MAEKLKWIAIIFAVIFLILSIVMTVLYFNKASNCTDKITKLNLVYSKTNNSNLKNTETKIEAFLIEKASEVYLFIPGFGTQNKLKWTKLGTGTNPTEVKSNTVEELKNYNIPTTPSQQPGYFNNCAIIQNAEWALNNGVLSCKPFVYSSNSAGNITRSYPGIDLKNCGGSSIVAGTGEISSSFGATVIKLEKR